MQNATRPVLATNAAGDLVAGWTETYRPVGDPDFPYRTVGFVKRWNGDSWLPLGGALHVPEYQGGHWGEWTLEINDLVVDNRGYPTITLRISNNYKQINLYVWTWNGLTWEQLGGGEIEDYFENPHGVHFTSRANLALDSRGFPIVSWQNQYGAGNLYNAFYATIKRWNGSQWVELGEPAQIASSEYTDVDIAVDSSDNPVISYSELGKAYVKRWNGSAWVQMGTPLNFSSSQPAYHPTLVVDALDYPVVAWIEDSKIYVKRWNGSSWAQVSGFVSSLSDLYSEFDISLDSSGQPLISWHQHGRVYVKQFDGANWRSLTPAGQAVNDGLGGKFPSIVMVNNKPTVAWSENGDILVKEHRDVLNLKDIFIDPCLIKNCPLQEVLIFPSDPCLMCPFKLHVPNSANYQIGFSLPELNLSPEVFAKTFSVNLYNTQGELLEQGQLSAQEASLSISHHLAKEGYELHVEIHDPKIAELLKNANYSFRFTFDIAESFVQ